MKCNLKCTQSILSGCSKIETFRPITYIAPSSIIHITFSYAFSFMVPYFSLVLFKDIVRKQLTRKYKTWRIITEGFHFCASCLILCLSLRIFFKTVGELLHLLTVHTKLIFRGAIKKVIMVSEVKSYQIQYFTKIFPNPLVL